MTDPCALGRDQPDIHISQTGRDRVLIVASVPSGTQVASVGDVTSAATAAYEQIADTTAARGMEIVHERVFGSLSARQAVMNARSQTMNSRGLGFEGPVTFIQGRPVWGEGLAGVIVHAVSRPPVGAVSSIVDAACPAGRIWRSRNATFAILQNLQGLVDDPQADNSPAAQTARMLDRAERLLQSRGLSYRHVVRTWFYLANILDWYDEFNRVRNDKYGRLGLLPAAGSDELLLPASTGISGETPEGAACTMDLIAVAPDERGGPTIERLTNPRQKEAFRYGSAFARCALIGAGPEVLVQVSGTAAIDESGRSLYPGDIRAQVSSTLERLTDLLSRRDMGLADLSAATVFVKHAEHADVVRDTLAEFGLERFPAVFVVADVCRGDLLFEVDAEGVVREPRSC